MVGQKYLLQISEQLTTYSQRLNPPMGVRLCCWRFSLRYTVIMEINWSKVGSILTLLMLTVLLFGLFDVRFYAPIKSRTLLTDEGLEQCHKDYLPIWNTQEDKRISNLPPADESNPAAQIKRWRRGEPGPNELPGHVYALCQKKHPEWNHTEYDFHNPITINPRLRHL